MPCRQTPDHRNAGAEEVCFMMTKEGRVINSCSEELEPAQQ